jgi:two-component system, NarL family, response regulator NreC
LSDQIMQIMAEKLKPSSLLTKREISVLQLLAEGKSNREIAELLFISIHTVNAHRSNIKKKLNLRKTADLVKYAIQQEHTSLEHD